MSRRANKPDTQADLDIRECLDSKTSFIVVAGAGSGKTTSLIKALKYIDEKEGRKLRQDGRRIACITYTTTAESEILEDVGHDPLFHVSTIHSFLWELVRSFQPDIKRWVTEKIDSKIAELDATRIGFGPRVRQQTRDRNQAEILRYTEMARLIHRVNEFSYETASNYTEGLLGHNDIISMAPELISRSSLLQNILTKKYPYFFIDESQDTIRPFIDAMKIVESKVESFCLGFFGDPMQKIYMTGTGPIESEEGWRQISKPENFRCATDVLAIINKIRDGVDELQQTGGRHIHQEGELRPLKGSAYLFVLQIDDQRKEKILAVRQYLANVNTDAFWLSDTKEADVRVLVMEHRMAAKRLKFEELFEVFNGVSESIGASFREGTHWSLQPFIKYIVPLMLAVKKDQQFQIIELLRQFCPTLQKTSLRSNEKPPHEFLQELKDSVMELYEGFENDKFSVKELFMFMRDRQLIILDDRIIKLLDGSGSADLMEEQTAMVDAVIGNYFNLHVKQMLGYQKYINDESVYSTQHSVKGAEFERVLVVLDDEEGKSNFYSYDKLLGVLPFSDTDQQNIARGADNTPARTRRLFYVCCSRALKDLGVILFVENPQQSKSMVEATGLFPVDHIKEDADLDLTNLGSQT
jgi:DNA helicase-2/ATP-dependent DNA helicase PcrA